MPNCKPGDLAVIVRSSCGNAGKIVRVIEPAPEVRVGSSYYYGGIKWKRKSSQCWIVESMGSALLTTKGRATRVRPFSDYKLRPLRDNDSDDEMLRIVGKPVDQGVTA